MGWFSILPSNLSIIELWAARIFILLALLTIGPWAALVLYDILLYLFRTVTYEIPVIGGRARGSQRPRAPSLTERRPRKFTLTASPSQSSIKTDPQMQATRKRSQIPLDGSPERRDAHRRSVND